MATRLGPERCLVTLAAANDLDSLVAYLAILGASRPEQLVDNAGAAGVKLDPELLARIDDILDPVIERDPDKVESFASRPDPSAPRCSTRTDATTHRP